MNTALARKGAQPVGLQDWQLMREQAGVLLASGFLPAQIKSPEAAITIMLKGRELDIPPLYALSNISVVNGKPTCGAELMMALVKRDLGRDAIRVLETTADHCTVEYQDGSHVGTFTFSSADAQKAGLWGKSGPWAQYPGAMLRARCISAACRFVFPDVIGGMYTPEELGAEVAVDEHGTMDVVTPSEPVQPSPAADRATPDLVEASTPVLAEAARAPMSAPAGGDAFQGSKQSEAAARETPTKSNSGPLPFPEHAPPGEPAPITAFFERARGEWQATRAQTRLLLDPNGLDDDLSDVEAVKAALQRFAQPITPKGLDRLFTLCSPAREPVTA